MSTAAGEDIVDDRNRASTRVCAASPFEFAADRISTGRFADNAEGGTELAGIVFSESLAAVSNAVLERMDVVVVFDRIGGRFLDFEGLGGGGELPRLERVLIDLDRVNDTLIVGSSLLCDCWSCSSSE